MRKLDTDLIIMDLESIEDLKFEAIDKLRYFEVIGVWNTFAEKTLNDLMNLMKQCKTRHARNLVIEVMNEIEDLTQVFEVTYGKRWASEPINK